MDLITPPAAEHNADTAGGPNIEITPSAHEIMAVIAPLTEPFLAYLNKKELPEDQNEARCIIRCSKAYKVHEGDSTRKALPESFKDVSPKKRGSSSWLKSMLVLAAIMPQLGLL